MCQDVAVEQGSSSKQLLTCKKPDIHASSTAVANIWCIPFSLNGWVSFQFNGCLYIVFPSHYRTSIGQMKKETISNAY